MLYLIDNTAHLPSLCYIERYLHGYVHVKVGQSVAILRYEIGNEANAYCMPSIFHSNHDVIPIQYNLPRNTYNASQSLTGANYGIPRIQRVQRLQLERTTNQSDEV